MARTSDAAKGQEEEYAFEEAEITDFTCQDRTLVLKREPMPRKVHLIAAGVREIRCLCCIRIRPIEGAEEAGEGWICGDCMAYVAEERKTGEQRRK